MSISAAATVTEALSASTMVVERTPERPLLAGSRIDRWERPKRPKAPAPKTTAYRTFVLLAASIVCRKSCRRKFCSDGVNILDTNEISGFTFGALVECVSEGFEPPVLKFFAMFRQ